MGETLSPNQLTKEAQRAYKRGDYLTAARRYQAAGEAYQTTGNHLDAAEMYNSSSVAFLQAGEVDLALQVVEGTDNIFADAGDLRRQGMALGNLGAALEAASKHDEAIEKYLLSAELLKKTGEYNLHANVMQSLSALQLKTGRQLEALATMQAGLAAVEKPSPQQRALKKLLQMPYKLFK